MVVGLGVVFVFSGHGQAGVNARIPIGDNQVVGTNAEGVGVHQGEITHGFKRQRGLLSGDLLNAFVRQGRRPFDLKVGTIARAGARAGSVKAVVDPVFALGSKRGGLGLPRKRIRSEK